MRTIAGANDFAGVTLSVSDWLPLIGAANNMTHPMTTIFFMTVSV
jgi:hypothetical protein